MTKPTPAPPPADVRLADESRMAIRPVEFGDKSLIAAAFAELSEEARYRRFFTPRRELNARQLGYATKLDHRDREAPIALDVRSGSGAGAARFVLITSEVAETAVVVVDPCQRLGSGDGVVRAAGQRGARGGTHALSGAGAGHRNRDAIRAFTHLGSSDDG